MHPMRSGNNGIGIFGNVVSSNEGKLIVRADDMQLYEISGNHVTRLYCDRR